MDPTTARQEAPNETARDESTASSKTLALAALEAALDKKGLAPVLIDLSGQSSYTDFILVLSGRSDRHVQHIADGIEQTLGTELGRRAIGAEGMTDGRWVLIDYGEVVIHVFYHPLRDFYDLEGLWCDAPRVELQIPEDARVVTDDVTF